ncbi:gametogenetin-binding 2 isoform X1, partial [Paramuricea clavata]
MAKLVRVCRNTEDEESLDNYQMPLVIDGDLKMIMEIPSNEILSLDEYLDCGSYSDFFKTYEKMNVDELAVSCKVTHNEVLSFLSQAVPCVGCRQSVEKLYNHIKKTSQPALQPLIITQSGVLTIDPSVLKDPFLLHTFLYYRG